MVIFKFKQMQRDDNFIKLGNLKKLCVEYSDFCSRTDNKKGHFIVAFLRTNFLERKINLNLRMCKLTRP